MEPIRPVLRVPRRSDVYIYCITSRSQMKTVPPRPPLLARGVFVFFASLFCMCVRSVLCMHACAVGYPRLLCDSPERDPRQFRADPILPRGKWTRPAPAPRDKSVFSDRTGAVLGSALG